jgi:hypothetical protein
MPCVYILTNPAIPGLVKIGHTAGSATDRAAQISQGTGVPTAYQVEWYCETTTAQSAAQLERDVHQHCAANRVNRAREFFNLTTTQAVAIIESIGHRASVIAITSPEVAARAAAEQARAAAEQAAAEQAAAQARAAAQAKRDEELRIQRQREASERSREASKARAEGEKIQAWLIGLGALLLLTPAYALGMILLLLAFWFKPQ